MAYILKPPVIKGGKVKVVRQGLGMGHRKQDHKAAPTSVGTWCWLFGYMEYGMTFTAQSPYAPKRPAFFTNTDLEVNEAEATEYYDRLKAWYKSMPKKLRYGWIDLDSIVYVGWNHKGEVTRSGFFNSGTWNKLTMAQALDGLAIIVARSRGFHSKKETGHYPWIDKGDIQIYVPKTTKIL